MTQCWIYHADKEPKIVDEDQAEGFYKDGWADSPAKFVKTTDFDVDPDDHIAVQNLGEAIEGVKDTLNKALNIESMSNLELKEFALESYGKEINGYRKTLLKKVSELINDNSTGNNH